MKLKGVRKLESKVNKFLAPFNLKSKLGEDFAYFFDSELVQFSVELVNEIDEEYIDFIKNEFDYNVPNMFLFSFLHEVGHHMTADELEEKDFEEDDALKFEISENINTDNFHEYALKYFHCPTEYLANKWAIDYYRKHEKEVNRKGKEMLLAFRHFYKINRVVA